MNTIIGLIIIALGSMGQSSSYVPINKVKSWSWESFWIVQGLFAWLIFPYLGALLAVPNGSSLTELIFNGDGSAIKAIGFGALWGIGGLTFGLSMRYLGIALGQSIALGTCSAFGTIIPAIMNGNDLFSGQGLMLTIGVSIALAGIAVIGFAGSLRSKNMTNDEKTAAIKDFALGKGLLVAILAGVMSACFSLGLEASEPIRAKALTLGTNALFAGLPAVLLVTTGGFITNAVYCFYQNYKNKTMGDYLSVSKTILLNNLLFCGLAGILWYSQFFGLALGKSYFTEGSVMMAFSWSILMSLNITFSNVWGIVLKEWKGASKQTMLVLITGLVILILSTFAGSF